MPPVISILQTTLNASIKDNERALEMLSSLSGKIVCWQYNSISVYFIFTLSNIICKNESSSLPDLILDYSPWEALQIISAIKNNHPIPKDIPISDNPINTQVQALFSSLHINWKDILTKMFGKNIGSCANEALSLANVQLKDHISSIRLMTSEYITKEKDYFISKEEMSDFNNTLFSLRYEIDRATESIEKLKEIRNKDLVK